MPSTKSDPYATQISLNIFKLTNLSPIPFEIETIFQLFNQPALLRFFEQHRKLGYDIGPFVFAMLVHIAAMLDGVELYNPDGTGFITSLNLFLQLIGEPGTNKSGLFRNFNNCINVLKKVFPSFFSKPFEEVINGREKETTIDLIANNETELSLYQRLSRRENVFISTDELDVINNRFGVYLAGDLDNDVKTVGSKLLCQCYDIIKNASRTTGSSSFFVERGSLNIFGASTGNMLSSICRQYNSNIMSDGTISRYLFVATSAHKTSYELPSEILSVQPNIVHILIVARLLAQYKPIFVFGEYPSRNDLSTPITVPLDIEEARQNILNPIAPTERMSILKPSVIVTMEKNDEEQDGSILSPYDAIRRIMDFEYQKSLQIDMNGNPIYTPLQRAFQRKSGNKLARLAGLCETISYAIQLCTECINIVRFGDGLHLKESIDNEELNWLRKFHNTVNELIKRDITKAPKYGNDQGPLLLIGKAAIHASEMLHQYNASTVSALFNDISSKIINKSTKTDDNNMNNIQASKDAFSEEQAILLKMESPILLKAWFSNPVTGLPFTNLFANYRKSTQKTLKLTQAIDQLVANGILQNGIKDTRHIVTARKETYLKTSPATIRRNAHMLNYLQSIGINIDEYDHAYLTSPLPMNMELTKYTVDFILSDDDYLEFCHLFNDTRIQQQMEERLSKNHIQYRMSFGRKQYYIPLSSQIVQQDSETQDVDAPQVNNDLYLTFMQSSHRSIANVSPPMTCSASGNSSLFSEIHNLAINNASVNDKVVAQLVTDAESNDNFEHEDLPSIDDALSQLCSMLNPTLSDTSVSTLASNTTETIHHEPVSHPLSLYSTQSHIENTELSSNNDNNNNNNNNNNNSDTFLSTGTISYSMAAILQNMNSQQSLELISDLVRNKKHVVKRILEQENDDFISKRLRNNEHEDVIMPSFHLSMDLNASLPSTPTQIQSNSSSGDDQVSESDYHNSARNKYPTNSTPNSGTDFTSFSNTDTTSTSMNDEFPLARTVDTIIESTDQEINTTKEATGVNNQEQTTVNPQEGNDTDLTEVYQKLILCNSVVISKSEICTKLKHVAKISTIRDKILSSLVNDKLLIKGNWFATKRSNGSVTLMSGYLKTFPTDDIQDQQDFARLLATYGIHYHEFEQSFKKKKTDQFPCTLNLSDIKFNNKWLFSTELADVIENNSFLRERILLDPLAIIQETNVSLVSKKRYRKPQQRYSPSNNE